MGTWFDSAVYCHSWKTKEPAAVQYFFSFFSSVELLGVPVVQYVHTFFLMMQLEWVLACVSVKETEDLYPAQTTGL